MRFMLNPLLSWLTVSAPLYIAEMTETSGELGRLPTTVVGFLPRLFVPRHEPHKIHPPEPSLGAANSGSRAARRRGRRGADPDQRPRHRPKGSGAGRRGRRGAGIRRP